MNATVELTTDELGAVGRGLELLREVLKAHPAGGLALLKAVGGAAGKLAAARAVAEARENGLDEFLKRVRRMNRRLCRNQIPAREVAALTLEAARIGPVAFGHPDWRRLMARVGDGDAAAVPAAASGAKKGGK